MEAEVSAKETSRTVTFEPHMTKADKKRKRMRGVVEALPDDELCIVTNLQNQGQDQNQTQAQGQNRPVGRQNTRKIISNHGDSAAETSVQVQQHLQNEKQKIEYKKPKWSNMTWHRQGDSSSYPRNERHWLPHRNPAVEASPNDMSSRPFQKQNFRRDCHYLRNQLYSAFDARERNNYMWEEELSKREEAVFHQEQLVAQWKSLAQADRVEAAEIKQQATRLREQVLSEKRKLEEQAKKLQALTTDFEECGNSSFALQLSTDKTCANPYACNVGQIISASLNDHGHGRGCTKDKPTLCEAACPVERLETRSHDIENKRDINQANNAKVVEAGEGFNDNKLSLYDDKLPLTKITSKTAVDDDTGTSVLSESLLNGKHSQIDLVASDATAFAKGSTESSTFEMKGEANVPRITDTCKRSIVIDLGCTSLNSNKVHVNKDEGDTNNLLNENKDNRDRKAVADRSSLDDCCSKELMYCKSSLEGREDGNTCQPGMILSTVKFEGDEHCMHSKNVCMRWPTVVKSEFDDFDMQSVNGDKCQSSMICSIGKSEADFTNIQNMSNCSSDLQGRSSVHGELFLLNPKNEETSEYKSYCEDDKVDHLSLKERQSLYKKPAACLSNFEELQCLDVVKGEYDFTATQSSHIRNSVLPKLENDTEQKLALPFTETGNDNKELQFAFKKKKQKTKTCSSEKALQEDAPGLLEILQDKGYSIDNLKLYDCIFDGEIIDEATENGNFKELEAVVEKLWGNVSGLIKMGRLRQTANRHTYCLACLLSLIEQTKTLQLRKWPVEWGWCRELQSFIFVFERHNRIVLERPEYGYATYFFELVQSLPVSWQVRRLICVMGIANCSRMALLENKPLMVGEDISAEEAKVLEEYGWTPNSGFGSLLNYCDRVVHDRKADEDDMEWRSKIGKLLRDGYTQGSIYVSKIPEKLRNILLVKQEEM